MVCNILSDTPLSSVRICQPHNAFLLGVGCLDNTDHPLPKYTRFCLENTNGQMMNVACNSFDYASVVGWIAGSSSAAAAAFFPLPITQVTTKTLRQAAAKRIPTR